MYGYTHPLGKAARQISRRVSRPISPSPKQGEAGERLPGLEMEREHSHLLAMAGIATGKLDLRGGLPAWQSPGPEAYLISSSGSLEIRS